MNGLSHLGAALAAGIGLGILLYLGRGKPLLQAALFIYGVSLVLMFSASSVYHLVIAGPGMSQWLRKLDHSAIYLLIAGTYTPICLRFFEGFWRWGLLAIIWSMAVVGIAIKMLYIRAPRGLSAGIYLLMGWMSIFGLGKMIEAMPTGALAWLLAGGILFSLGAVIYILKRPNFVPGVFGFHEIWHIFVIFGALSHFVLVARYVAWG